MRCNPLRWLWGLLPLAIWLWLATLSERPRIEADLTKRTQEALNAAGHAWASVSFSGRDGVIVGRAQDDGDAAKALDVARGVRGVRVVNAQTDLIEKVETYLWSASTKDGSSIRLSGYVPSETARKTVVGLVKAQFPKAEVDDRMKLARGAPDQDTWLGGIGFAAKQLSALKHGHVELSGTDLSVAGEAATAEGYQGISSAIRNKLPKGLKLASDKVTPPVVTPYVWSAVKEGKDVVLSGFVPSEKAREDLVAHAKKSFAKVVDKLQLGEGAPDHFARGAAATLDQLARLNSGHAELKANHLNLSGDAGDEASADNIRKAWKSALPGSLKTSDALMYTKAPEPPAVDVAAQKAAEEAEAARKAAEAKKAADEAEAHRKAAEAKKAADEAEAHRKAAEAKKAADEAEAHRKAAEAKKAADEAEAHRKAAEAKKAADEAEAHRKAAEAKKAADEAEAQRKAAEAKKATAALEERKAEAQRCQDTVRKLAKEGVIRFERASADLHADSSPTLKKLAGALNACPGMAIEVEGHTDAEGTPERNLRLSERRAQSVADFLSKNGVAAERLKSIGYGETRPVAPNDTAENRALNRRIEFGVKAQ